MHDVAYMNFSGRLGVKSVAFGSNWSKRLGAIERDRATIYGATIYRAVRTCALVCFRALLPVDTESKFG